jgi:DNA-binding response OmpR family regulator
VDIAVLWVGASEAISGLYETLFVALEADLCCVREGTSAMMAEARRFDLVIIDNDMGFEAGARVIEALHRPSISGGRPRILALTNADTDVRAYLEAGADAVRLKPISARALLDELGMCRSKH